MNTKKSDRCVIFHKQDDIAHNLLFFSRKRGGDCFSVLSETVPVRSTHIRPVVLFVNLVHTHIPRRISRSA